MNADQIEDNLVVVERPDHHCADDLVSLSQRRKDGKLSTWTNVRTFIHDTGFSTRDSLNYCSSMVSLFLAAKRQHTYRLIIC